MEIAFVLLLFFLFSRYPQRVSENPYSSKVTSFPRFFLLLSVFLLVLVGVVEEGGVYLRSPASLRLKARFSLTVCLILKLGDSYL